MDIIRPKNIKMISRQGAKKKRRKEKHCAFARNKNQNKNSSDEAMTNVGRKIKK